MKILVTGVAGAIGSHVAEALAKRGDAVFGIDNIDPYYDPVIKMLALADVKEAGVEVVIADINTIDLTTLGNDIEAIVHFAAQPGISAGTPFAQYVANNIHATYALLEYAKTLPKLKLFLHISTSSVYGRSARGSEDVVPMPTSPYGVTKLAAEQLALSRFRSDGLPVAVLRLFSVYGPRERPEKLYHKLTHAMLLDKPFPLYEGSEKHERSFTYVGDVVDACLRALDRYETIVGEIINIGSSAVHTTGEGIRIIESLARKKAELVLVPPRYGDQIYTKAVIEKAKRLLDFVPNVSLEEGLQRQFDWHEKKLFPHLKKEGKIT